ncbi:MAG: molybdopterin-containing oxidoreductase family protein [Solirubrobacterales bacterium]
MAGEWRKTGCALCAQNCGLELLIEDNRIVKVRGDKDNPRSEGYLCRKGMNIANFQHHAQRLTHPLKRVDGQFVKISWDQALDEIAEKLRQITTEYGPRSLAYMGGGGLSCHFEAAFGVRVLRGLGSRYHYTALGQELTGKFWGWGRAVGKQYLCGIPDEDHTDMLVAIGWNPWMSHQMPQARRRLQELKKDPDRLLVVIDPRESETAKMADLHLAVRPGTDALLFKAMIALILQKGWQNQTYIDEHVTGFDEIKAWFTGVDVQAALAVCGLEYEPVEKLCRWMTTRRWCSHSDLGILMGRHSTVNTYLEIILLAICGRIGVPGGSVIPGYFMPLGSHSDETDSKTWRTVTTGFPALMGVFPPNVMPEEILSDHPERVRAVLVTQSNPLRSYADTTAFEKAFARLDLLVTAEIAMTETAVLSHYVLPSRSTYESWDGTFFPMTYPKVYFQMRRPVIEPEGEPLEISEIHVRLADRLGLIPPIPDGLVEAGTGDRLQFGMALMNYLKENPKSVAMMPFILAKTLGRGLGSTNLAALWGMLQATTKDFRANAARAGFTPGPLMGEEIFKALMDHPEGIWIGCADEADNFTALKTEDGRVHVHIPEMADWIYSITPESEAASLVPPPEYPLVLMAGRHMDMNANSLMRNPEWNKGRRACTLAMNPADAESLGLTDGQTVRITTEAASEEIELEVSPDARPGQVIIPHGFGIVYEGKAYGVNVNRLTKNTSRDPFAATPIHRYVPCRVERV